jgi:hypothetical protein
MIYTFQSAKGGYFEADFDSNESAKEYAENIEQSTGDIIVVIDDGGNIVE